MTKKIDPATKRLKKQTLLVERTAKITGVSPDEVTRLLSAELTQSVRINPLVAPVKTTLHRMQELDWQGEPVEWCENGYTIETGFEALRDSKLIETGAIYIQNEASWLPVIALNPLPNDTVLDVCAAPGGKTNHIASLMDNDGTLIANDNSKPRLLKLQTNSQRLNTQAQFTLHDATRLARAFPAQSFDKILLDAPCSGEGLLSLLRPKSLDTWSVAHIRRLAVLQKRILLQSWQLLKPGGRLVYSTCTMAPEENEAVIDWLLKRAPDANIIPLSVPIPYTQTGITIWNNQHYDSRIRHAKRLFPHNGREAFFTCILERQASKGVA